MIYSRIIGTGSYFPERVLTNQDLEKMVDTSDEWITSRTGIKMRHTAGKIDKTSDMAYKASLNAIEMAGIQASEIDGILLSTVSQDYSHPSTATIVQNKLGISGSFAVDMNAACSGFLYGINMADALIKSGKHKTLLVVGAEHLTSQLDYTDRTTCVLFGDGSGAAIVRADTTPGILSTNMGADGSCGELLYMKGMGSVMLANRDTMNIEENLLKMRGNDVFKHAVIAITTASEKAMADSGLRADQLTYIIPHQANIRIMEGVAKRFGADMSKVLVNIDRRGNTSSATIPTVLDENIRSGKIKRGDNLLLCAFGGGFTWAAATVTY